MIKTTFALSALAFLCLNACTSMPFMGEKTEDEAAQQDASSNMKTEAPAKGFIPSFIKPYKFDIQQGNLVTQEEVDRLKVGMTRDQVRFILGTPLLQDPFHQDRWDYPFRLIKADGSILRSTYTVIFKSGALARHGGQNLPATQAEALGEDGRVKRRIEAVEPPESDEKTDQPADSTGPTQ